MKDNKSDRYNLAIIGASGTGKTTLAVGLYATSTKTFTVSPDGDETLDYLEIRKTSIEEGFWPAATNEEKRILRLRLHAAGKQTDISFFEYMGERMERDPNYIREVIGTPKSAMILFNPGMPGLSKPETRNRMLGNLKVIAQHLKDNGCIAVAFVVTASDRLTSDLSSFREDFEAYASEVTNHLTNLGLDWRRFEVTVSGQLDDQNKPRLARGESNTTHEPFLWLLKRISDRRRRKSLLTTAAVFATLLGVSCAVFGGLVVHSRQVLTRAEADFANATNELNIAYAAHDEAKARATAESFKTNRFVKICAILPSDRTRKQELISRVNEQCDLWGVRLLRMEFASNTNKIATNPLDVQLNWFENFNKRLTEILPVFSGALTERDELSNEWTTSRFALETKCQAAHFSNNVTQERKNLVSAKPDALTEPLKKAKELIEDKDRNYSLVTNRAELCVISELITARTDAIARYIDSKIGKPEDDKRPADTEVLCQQVGRDLKNVLTIEEFDNLSRIISVRNDEACKAWDANHFPKKVTDLETALNGAGADPSCPLTDSLAFLDAMTNNYPTISTVEFIKARHAIEAARKNALIAYANSIAGKWNANGSKPPEFDSKNIRNIVLTQTTVTEEEYLAFESEMNIRFDFAKREWNTNQKKLVDGFSVDGGIEVVTRDYGAFIEEHLNNPYLNDLHNRMKKRLNGYFVRYIKDYCSDYFGEDRVGDERYLSSRMERVQRKFNEFRQVCLCVAGRGWSESPLQKSEIGKFAKLCVDRGHLNAQGINAAFEQTMTIRKVEVRFAPAQLDSDYIQMIFAANLIAERWNGSNDRDCIADASVFSSRTVPRDRNNQWVELWSGTCSVLVNPWTFTKLILWYEDHQDAILSSGSDKYSKWLWLDAGPSWEGEINVSINSGGLNMNTKGVLSLRVTYDRSGPDFISLWKEAGNNVKDVCCE